MSPKRNLGFTKRIQMMAETTVHTSKKKRNNRAKSSIGSSESTHKREKMHME
jgi:hypothetical protein